MKNHHIVINLKLTSHGAGRLFLIIFLVAFGMAVTGCRSTGQINAQDTLAEKNRDRLRSICNAWYYNSDAPAVTEKIEKSNQTFHWTQSCEIATGSFNSLLGKQELGADTGDCWSRDAQDEFTNESDQCEYKRYLKTALDVGESTEVSEQITPPDMDHLCGLIRSHDSKEEGDPESIRYIKQFTKTQDLICYFAVMDRDNDRVPDFMVSDHGRFTQNDTDVDNDGVRNVRDSNPVNADAKARHACGKGGFPEHLKLSTCDIEGDEACALQQALFQDFDIVTTNREFADDDPRIVASLRVIYDVMNLVFKQGMEKLVEDVEAVNNDCPELPTLPSFKTVSFEHCPHDTLRVGDGEQECLIDASTTGAEAISQNGTFVVVPLGANYESLFKLGIFVHELGHLFSFALDYDEGKYDHLVRRNYWESTGLRDALKPLGWSIDLKKEADRPNNEYRARTVLNVQDHIVFDESSYKWNGSPVTELVSMIECGVETKKGCSEEDQENRPGYLAYIARFQKNNDGLFTWYGAGDPWEWISEASLAYVYRSLSEHIATKDDKVVSENTRVLLRARVLEFWSGNDNYFENMSDFLFGEFKKIFPISPEQLDELVCRYIVNSDDVLFGGKLTRTPESFDAAGVYIGYSKLTEVLEPKVLKMKLDEQWKSTCDEFKNLQQAIVKYETES